MFNKQEFNIAAIFGLTFGVITYLILSIIEPEVALMFASFTTLMGVIYLYIYLLIHNKRMEKRYVEVEKK